MPGAAAAQSFTYSGDTSGNPTWNRPSGLSSLSGVGNNVPYQSFIATIFDPANFRAEAVSAGFPDIYMVMYFGAFDPLSPLTNIVAFDDDDGPGLLSRITAADGPFVVGEYTVVMTGFSNDDFGTYTIEFDGATILVVGAGGDATTEAELLVGTLAFDVEEARFRSLPGMVRASLDARGARAFSAAAGDPVAGQGSAAQPVEAGLLAGGFHLWAEVGGYRSEREASVSYTSSIFHTQVGIDVALDEGIVAGLAGGVGLVRAAGGGSDLEGEAYWIQPYLGFDVGFVRGAASVSAAYNSYGDYTVTGALGSASGHTLAANLFLAHDIDAGYGLAASPFVEVGGGVERITDFGGALAGAADAELGFFSAAAGIEFRADFGAYFGAEDLAGYAFLRPEIRYSVTDAPSAGFGVTGYDGSQLGLGLAAGAQFALGEGISAAVSAEVDGIGSDVIGFGASARLDLTF